MGEEVQLSVSLAAGLILGPGSKKRAAMWQS